MEVIVLAGGMGTRLATALPDLPKALAPIGKRPFLEILLDSLRKQGMKSAILSLGCKSEMIQSHFGNCYEGMALLYQVEEVPLGTGGAARCALRLAGPGPVFVVNGDTIADIDFRAMCQAHLAEKALVSIAAVHVQDVSRYGSLVVSDGHVAGFQEKGRGGAGLINSGTYLLNSDVFVPYELPESFSIEDGFFSAHLESLHPLAFESHGYFIDIGVPEDLARARRELV
jgi:D-glycero-alpha-D-manno-heptose 1-phosphate guanylyltransferase